MQHPRRIFSFCRLLAGLLAAALPLAARAQAPGAVGIGTATPNANAALDITATGKGLLIPRMDSATRAGIAAPPDGLMVFQTDGRQGFWYAMGNAWLYIPDKTKSGDNLGSHTATRDLGLNDHDLRLRGAADTNHGLGWYGNSSSPKNWLGQNLDGPVLYGNGGGVLAISRSGVRQSVLNWTSAGRVGIGRPDPQQKLHVAGTVAADGGTAIPPTQQYAYTSAQTRTLMISPFSFVSSDPTQFSMVIANGFNNTQLVVVGNTLVGTGTRPAVAPLTLPVGAVVTNLELFAIDSDGVAIPTQAYLVQVTPTAGALATNTVSAAAVLPGESDFTQVASTPVAVTIDSNSHYHVSFSANRNLSVILMGVRLTYTVSKAE